MGLSEHDVQFVRDLVRRHSAIVLDGDKAYLIEARLGALCRTLPYATPSELIAELRARPSTELQRRVLDAMTVNETSFFRDIHPFAAMRTTVLPELIEARAASRKLTIWSAASSSGQEPYSVAMLLRERFPQLASWSVRIIATDLSREMLDRARAGRYSQFEVNRGLPVPMLLKYFTQRGSEWELSPSIRQMVEFREVNLAAPLPPMPPLDLVLLRNVLIYFDAPAKQRVLSTIRRIMEPDGWLCLGSGETSINIEEERFTRVAVGPALWLKPTLASGTLPPRPSDHLNFDEPTWRRR